MSDMLAVVIGVAAGFAIYNAFAWTFHIGWMKGFQRCSDIHRRRT
jgi:hypothetical protein